MCNLEQLLSNGDVWRAVFDSLPDLVFLLDDGWRILRANAAAAARLGVHAEELAGQSCLVVLHGAEQLAACYPSAATLSAAQASPVWLYAERLERYFAVSLTPLINQRGDQVGTLYIGRDIGQRKPDDAVLKYQTLADFSNDWEYWRDGDSSFRYMSPSCELITGHSLLEFMSNPALVHDLVLAEDRGLFEEHVRTCHDAPQVGRIVFRMRRRDGRIIWLEHMCRPVLNRQGNFLGTRVSNRDVTERKENEAALQAAVAEITQLKEQLQTENICLHDVLKGEHDFDEIVGQSEALRATLHKVEHVAATSASVLLLGETGSGKELFARAIYERSPRCAKPLVKVNCAALPASLIESELFGHVQGAFTGALENKLGRFELADGGTLFLDEIGELDPGLQVKLLRILQDGEFERIGSTQTRRVDVRLIAATNRDLHEAMNEGTFRPDLYYRLSVFPIELPPLRSRREDIPLLVWHFIMRAQRRLGKTMASVSREAMQQLQQYDWPGNVRELQNVIERAMILSPGSTLVLSDSLGSVRRPTPRRHVRHAQPTGDSTALRDVDRAHIVGVLEECGWKVKGPGNAAERLGLKASTLRFRMKKLGIERCPVKPR